jgi:hypothetical protein
MSAEGVTLVGLVVIFAVVIGVIIVNDLAYRREDLPITQRTQASGRLKSSTPHTQWPPVWMHDAPRCPLDVPDAHRIMQAHRECRIAECPRKQAAYRTLVDAGRIVPAGPRR